jgi:DNA mismatch repair protein MutS
MTNKSPLEFPFGGSSGTRTPLNLPFISLMWPQPRPMPQANARPWHRDLGLGDLVRALTEEHRYSTYVHNVLANLITEPEVIAWRQAVLADFLANEELASTVEGLLPRLTSIREGQSLLGRHKRSLLLETADRLAEMEMYVEIVQLLGQVLNDSQISSAALLMLRDGINRLLDDENFQQLRDQLPELRAPLQRVSSLTIGVNLDVELRPASAVLLSINDRPMGESVSLLDRLLGGRSQDSEETGIASMHRLPTSAEERALSALFQDLDRLLADVAKPIARTLERYVKTSSGPLVALENEFAFYVFTVRMMRRLEARGIVFCRPEIEPGGARIMEIDGLMNASLCLREARLPVPSDVRFDHEGRIAILTGPNSGGKTTYVQAVGLAQVMFQAGMFIPAKRARISPVNRILTHFPALETREQGRLAEEAGRLRSIFQQVSAHSLVLLNETFSSTAFGEALYLAQDILCALRVVGARALFATHIIELVETIDEMESSVQGESRLFGLVAGIQLNDEGMPVPNFRVMRGKPLGRSYAAEIARQHGISLDQILAARREDESDTTNQP